MLADICAVNLLTRITLVFTMRRQPACGVLFIGNNLIDNNFTENYALLIKLLIKTGALPLLNKPWR